MSHYLGLCASFKGKNDFSNFVSVQVRYLDRKEKNSYESGNVDKIPCGCLWMIMIEKYALVAKLGYRQTELLGCLATNFVTTLNLHYVAIIMGIMLI